MAPLLQECMEDLIKVFYSYSGKEGDKYKLSKAELRLLIKEELGDFLAASRDPTMVDKIMCDLDENKDGQVDFQEFVIMVATLTVACNDFFVGLVKDCQQ
ncbi:protein S100-A1-like [Cheilinus undulatus]|uniref:protein S100-A1-like n=1 Tax=Cheilinus undulatus TaxID=241271 RepID=UPI001BD4977C|nr:protein S100-A1-like [Cheilinus undulatus]